MSLLLDKIAPHNNFTGSIFNWVDSFTGIKSVFTTFTNIFFTRPLAWLYLKGPFILGMWGSLPQEDICAQLTGTKTDTWVSLPNECVHIINNHFHSWVIFLYVLIYFILLTICVKSCCKYINQKRIYEQKNNIT